MRKLRLALVLFALGAAFHVIEAGPAWAPCHIATFEGDPYSVKESAGKVTLTVSNNGGAQTTQWSVDYSTQDGTAKAPGDYKSTSDTLTLPPGDGEGSFTIQINNDTVNEKTEAFTVRLSNLDGCPGFEPNTSDTAMVLIADNDPKPQPPPAPAPTQTRASSPKTSTPASTATATATPTATPTRTTTPTPTPTPTDTESPVPLAQPDDGGGLSGGAIAGIVAGVVVLGGAGAFWVRRRFLT